MGVGRIFLSTLSLRRATVIITSSWEIVKFLSTLSLRRATCLNTSKLALAFYFYPRSPCGERPKTVVNNIVFMPREFLSTLSLRRATLTRFFRSLEDHNFYPRSPCGERPFYPPEKPLEIGISIHALLAESDLAILAYLILSMLFLSTLSLRRATANDTNNAAREEISIHALLAESDRF